MDDISYVCVKIQTVSVKVKTDNVLLTQQCWSEVTQTGSGPDRSADPVLSLWFPEVRGHTAAHNTNQRHKQKSKTTHFNTTVVKAQYLIGGSSVHVPPRPVSYWSRDSQLIGGEVFCLLRVCRRKQSVSQQREHGN